MLDILDASGGGGLDDDRLSADQGAGGAISWFGLGWRQERRRVRVALDCDALANRGHAS